MKFHPTSLHGAVLVEQEPHGDTRGSFTRTFCTAEFAKAGLDTGFPQHSTSLSVTKGTLRGIHFQRAPHEESKLVRCLRGAVYDVIVDLRPASPTFLQWEGFELTAAGNRQIYIPKGFAHGFQTLADDTELNYLISAAYEPSASAGYRYDDLAFAIRWPLPVTVIADKDLAWPEFVE
jgi:dTDP-4-dehydrorhamnose 3,5-epimerase